MELLLCLHRRRFAVEVVNKTRLPIFFFLVTYLGGCLILTFLYATIFVKKRCV